jgi:Fe-S cluster assembly iron-binding protein IscA
VLNVSEKAAELLFASLQASRKEESEVLRLIQTREGLGLAIDKEGEGDQVVQHDNNKVLVIQPEISQALDGATLDAVETPDGQRLTLQARETQ